MRRKKGGDPERGLVMYRVRVTFLPACRVEKENGGRKWQWWSQTEERDKIMIALECQAKDSNFDLQFKEISFLVLGCGQRWIWRCHEVQGTTEERCYNLHGNSCLGLLLIALKYTTASLFWAVCTVFVTITFESENEARLSRSEC